MYFSISKLASIPACCNDLILLLVMVGNRTEICDINTRFITNKETLWVAAKFIYFSVVSRARFRRTVFPALILVINSNNASIRIMRVRIIRQLLNIIFEYLVDVCIYSGALHQFRNNSYLFGCTKKRLKRNQCKMEIFLGS